MSLSGALSNAITGLTAASRSAQIVSSNLANAMTEGYGRREIALEAQHARGGGVRVLSTIRHSNPTLITELRAARADEAAQNVSSGFFAKLESLVGTADSGDSISARLADLEARFVSAASRPDQAGRLDETVRSSKDLARSLNRATQGIQDARVAADKQIAKGVEGLNSKLSEIHELNVQIAGGSVAKRDVSALLDQRQILIDSVSEWIPIKEMERPNQSVALYTAGGALLVDGEAAELSFTPAHTIVPHMTLTGGHLSGVEVNGVAAAINGEGGPLRGGRLAALFELRDRDAVSAQAELDAMARDLAARFQTPGLDASVGAGDPGLFTDDGSQVAPINEIGLAGRLSVNPLVDAAQGGESRRLRDGLGAAVAGPVGNAAQLQSFADVLSAPRPANSGSFSGQSLSASELSAQVLSRFASDRLSSEAEMTFAATRASEVETMLLSDGVDSDQEMQKLMMIEQAYAANAQMMKTVDEMMNTLLRMG